MLIAKLLALPTIHDLDHLDERMIASLAACYRFTWMFERDAQALTGFLVASMCQTYADQVFWNVLQSQRLKTHDLARLAAILDDHPYSGNGYRNMLRAMYTANVTFLDSLKEAGSSPLNSSNSGSALIRNYLMKHMYHLNDTKKLLARKFQLAIDQVDKPLSQWTSLRSLSGSLQHDLDGGTFLDTFSDGILQGRCMWSC